MTQLTIGVFATPDCRPRATRLAEMIGGNHVVKTIWGGVTYAQQVLAFAKKYSFDAVIITDAALLSPMLSLLPDFIHPRNKNGSEKTLSMNDYHGSFIKYKKEWFGGTKDVDVLFLNTLDMLVKLDPAPTIYKRHISKITKPGNWFPQTDFTWEIVDEANCDSDRFESLLRIIDSAILVGVDIETDRDTPHRTIACAGYCYLLADGTTHSVVLPTRSLLQLERMRRLNDTAAPKVMQGGTYDAVYFLRWNAPLRNWLYDTSNLFHSWYSELPKRLDYITAFAIRYVRYWKDDAASGGSFEFYQYNARDCWSTLMAWCSLILEVPDWAKANYLQEFPINFPCIHMELDGLATDKEEFDKSLSETEEKIRDSQRKLSTWIHPDFNPRSPDQCKRLLYAFGYRDRNGEVTSSDEPTLIQASATHPLLERLLSEILEYRGLAKLRDTYLVWDKIWDGRLFYRLNPNGTDTGRLSSSESSFWCGLQIQNVPRGKEVKRWIRSDNGWLLAEGDYAQSEARCVGYLSGCGALIELVESPHDYHAWNASSFFGVPYESIYDDDTGKTLDKPLRDLSKRVNHGANYNMTKFMLLITMGPKKVAEARRTLGLKSTMSLLEVCDLLLSRYEKTYPEVKGTWYDKLTKTVSITHKLVSATGWTRYFFGNPVKSKSVKNSMVAHSPQNLSVALINKAMMRLYREMLFGELRGVFRMKAQIHDSIFFGYKKEADWVPYRVKDMMRIPQKVVDIHGVARTMVIPPDMNSGETHWSKLK